MTDITDSPAATDAGALLPPVEGGEAGTDAGSDAITKDVEKTAEAEDGKEPEKTDSKEPVTYQDFTLPEGFEQLEPASLAEYKTWAAELGLKQEQAQAGIGLAAQFAQRIQAQYVDAFHKRNADWQAEIKNDKELGGDKLTQNAQLAVDAIKKIAGKDAAAVRDVLESNGIINNPSVFRFFVQLGRLTAEDNFKGNSTGNAEIDMARAHYPTSTN